MWVRQLLGVLLERENRQAGVPGDSQVETIVIAIRRLSFPEDYGRFSTVSHVMPRLSFNSGLQFGIPSENKVQPEARKQFVARHLKAMA